MVNYKDLLDCGSYAGAREKGLVRMEGKEYIVKDGDVILFQFSNKEYVLSVTTENQVVALKFVGFSSTETVGEERIM